MLLQFPDGRVAACHDMLQALIDLFLRPAQALNILRPFKIANGDTSRVGEDVRDDRDPTFVQDFVGFRIGGRIGSFDNGFRLDISRDFGSDHSAERCRDEDICRRREDLLVGNVRDPFSIIFGERTAQTREVRQRRYLNAFRICNPARGIADGNDPGAKLMGESCDKPADVAETLNGNVGAFQSRAAISSRTPLLEKQLRVLWQPPGPRYRGGRAVYR